MSDEPIVSMAALVKTYPGKVPAESRHVRDASEAA